MKVLVTGATSGLGKNAAQWLLSAGHDVIALGRDVVSGQELAAQGATFIAQDLTLLHPTEWEAYLSGVDWVWHCAALSSPWGRWQDFYAINTQVTEQLACAAGKAGVKRFVHISTPSIYFDFQNRHHIKETFCVAKLVNHYAKSKALAEKKIVLAQQQYPQTRYTMLRPRAIFGPHDRVILPRVIAQIKHHKGILKLPKGGGALLDLTYVGNVVHAMYLASSQADLPPAAAYNITNQEPMTLSTVLNALLNEKLAMNFSIKALPYPVLFAVATGMEYWAKFTDKEPMLTRYSVGALSFDMTLCQQKAQDELGYRPIIDMTQAIALTANHLQQSSQI
jgi:nucleoside-diphosphate-sugar epimerase